MIDEMEIKRKWKSFSNIYNFIKAGRSGQSPDEECRKNTKDKQAGTNNWSLCQNCQVENCENNVLCSKGIVASDESKFEG